MRAMLLHHITDLTGDDRPLTPEQVPDPQPGENEILINVGACGVCHTELDEIEGRTPPSRLPMILGHQVVGTVVARGQEVSAHDIGDRVGVAWIFSACGDCLFCRSDQENLCPDFRATGRDANGGYAEYMTVGQDFAYPIPELFSDAEAAPLLCAGAIGYRSLRLAELQDGRPLGLTGFGASAHLVLKLARFRYPHSDVFVFARNPAEREFALSLGAAWAGDTAETAPQKLGAVIDTTPVWRPVVEALKNLAPGGRLVINAIRKEDVDKEELLRLDYGRDLWLEKEIKSVANVTRRDVRDFLADAAALGIRPEVQEYALAEANAALLELKTKKVRGAKVLRMDG